MLLKIDQPLAQMGFIWAGKRGNGDRGQKPCPTRFWMIPKYTEIVNKNAHGGKLLFTAAHPAGELNAMTQAVPFLHPSETAF